jgi:hypothetical protein
MSETSGYFPAPTVGRNGGGSVDFFADAKPTQAYLKAGLIGGAGDGKTYTSALLAIGLHQLLRERGLPEGNNPVAMLETSEFGVGWLIPLFEAAGIRLVHRKTRSFAKFADGSGGGGQAVDPVCGLGYRFWTEIVEAYKDALGRTELLMEDWAALKSQWAETMEDYKNLPAHIILAGRAGFEYGRLKTRPRADGIGATGVRMKAEGDTGYEPSLLVMMKKATDMSDPARPRIYRTATVMKDRSGRSTARRSITPLFSRYTPHSRH